MPNFDDIQDVGNKLPDPTEPPVTPGDVEQSDPPINSPDSWDKLGRGIVGGALFGTNPDDVQKTDSIVPTSSPIDLIAGAGAGVLASKIAPALVDGAGSLIADEAGSLGAASEDVPIYAKGTPEHAEQIKKLIEQMSKRSPEDYNTYRQLAEKSDTFHKSFHVPKEDVIEAIKSVKPKKFADGGDVPNPTPQASPEMQEPSAPEAVAPTPSPSGMQPQDVSPPNFDDIQDVSKGAAPKFDDIQDVGDEETKYTSPLQQLGAGVEGLGRGFAGPAMTAAELGLSKLGVPGMSAEEQAKREEYNGPIETVGKIGGGVLGLATGVGELAAISKGAQAVAKFANLGKFGSTVLKGALESGLFQGGDEISKAMIGQGDPEAPVAAALTNMGGAALLGGKLGGVVGAAGAGVRALGESAVGQKAAQFLGNFGRQWKFIQGNLDPVESATNEINGRMGETEQMMYGGLKRDLIQKLTSDVSPDDLSDHVGQVSTMLRKAPSALSSENTFKQAVQDWTNKVTPTVDPITLQPTYTPNAADVFQATDALKRQTQEWSQYNKLFTPAGDIPWRNASRGVSDALKGSLEDSDVWGPMGKAQAKINSNLSPMFGIQKEFQSKFASKEMGDKVADPTKINTYLYQVNRSAAKAGLKTNYVSNYLDQTQNLADAYNKIHLDNGIEAPFPQGLKPTPVLEHSLDPSPTRGAKFADWLGSTGYPTLSGQIASKTLSKGIGAGTGFIAGGLPGIVPGAVVSDAATEHLAPIIKSALGNKINKYAVPAALKVLSSGDTAGLPEVLQHAENVAKGSSMIKKSIDGLFKTPIVPQQIYSEVTASRNREKLKKMIEDGSLNDKISKAVVKSNPSNQQPAPEPTQSYAEGGEVKAAETSQETLPAEGANPMALHYPEQSSMLSTAKGRINNYLNSVRPQPDQMKLPFDRTLQNREKEKSYTRALDIANDPLSVLERVKEGNITPEHIQHLSGLYPEVYSHLKKQITKKISEGQMNEERPPSHKIAQGLSMFMGTPLDSSFTPQAIQAAQPMPPQPQPATSQAPESKPKRSMNALNKLPNQYQTSSQSAESDRSNRKE